MGVGRSDARQWSRLPAIPPRRHNIGRQSSSRSRFTAPIFRRQGVMAAATCCSPPHRARSSRAISPAQRLNARSAPAPGN